MFCGRRFEDSDFGYSHSAQKPTRISRSGEGRAATFPGSGFWGNYLKPIFFLVLGNLKFSMKYGENSILGNFHKFPQNPVPGKFYVFLNISNCFLFSSFHIIKLKSSFDPVPSTIKADDLTVLEMWFKILKLARKFGCWRLLR